MMTPNFWGAFFCFSITGNLGVHQEWSGPWRRVAGVGDGISQGREPFSSEGEVYPLPEGSSGPKPAQPGSLTAAGGHPAPGDRRTSHSGRGRKTPYSGILPLLAEV